MAFYRGPEIIRNGLILYLDAANSKSFRGEPTTNLANTTGGLIDWTIGNLIASVTLTTIESGLTYRITSTTGGAFRIRFDVSKLVNAQTYTMSYKYKIISGGPSFQATDWCDQSITRVTTNMGDYFYETATGSRSTYDSTYRFMDFTISNNTIVEIWDIQLEQKTYATPFTVSERGTTVATGGGLIDLSKNGNSGELISGVTYNSESNGCLVFDGLDDSVRISNTSYPINIEDPFTIECWAYIPSTATWTNGFYGNIITRGSYGGVHGIVRLTTDNQIAAYFRGNTSGANQSTGFISRDKWYYLTAVWTGSVGKLFINGELSNSNSTSLVGGFENPSFWYVGEARASAGNVGNSFDGKISNLKIYNRALSDTEILQNYNSTKSRFGL